MTAKCCLAPSRQLVLTMWLSRVESFNLSWSLAWFFKVAQDELKPRLINIRCWISIQRAEKMSRLIKIETAFSWIYVCAPKRIESEQSNSQTVSSERQRGTRIVWNVAQVLDWLWLATGGTYSRGFDVWFMVAIRTHKLIMQTRWKNTHCTLDIIIISIIRDESRTET